METAPAKRRDLVAAIERDKAELRAASLEIKKQLQHRLSLGHRMSARPGPWLIGSFCVGLFLGSR
jgi:hypothetical protein